MMFGRVHCQVVETPAQYDRLSRHRDWPRDLLPWADPYIAVLMARLERRYDWADESDDCPWVADEVEPHARDSWSNQTSWPSEAWQDDAFMPGRLEGRRPMFPPMYGGFPLLDDVTDGLEEDTL
jgi:hypothetical protein